MFCSFERRRGQQILGAKLEANSHSPQATPSHRQPSSMQFNGPLDDTRQRSATVRWCLLSSGSRVRILPGALTFTQRRAGFRIAQMGVMTSAVAAVGGQSDQLPVQVADLVSLDHVAVGSAGPPSSPPAPGPLHAPGHCCHNHRVVGHQPERAARRPLRRFEVLRGAGLEAARSSVSDLLTPFSVTPLGRSLGAEVLSDVSAVRLGPVSLVYARNTGAGLEVQLAQRVSYYDINFALEGANRIETADEQVVLSARRAGIISPQMVAAMQLSDGYGQLHVRIERAALERHLEGLLGRPVGGPVRFRMEMDLTAPAVAS